MYTYFLHFWYFSYTSCALPFKTYAGALLDDNEAIVILNK